MDGVHDVGGMHGYGPVAVAADEPVFAAAWERRTFGLAGVASRGSGGSFTPMRAAIERMAPEHYLASPYYEHWLTAAATLLVDAGEVDAAELAARAGGPFPLSSPAPADALAGGIGPPFGRARFRVDDPVRVRDLSPPGHTRCPRYVRRRAGTVVRVNAPTALPDLEAATGERVMETSYCVRFGAAELWGAGDAVVHVDLWDSYLDPA